MDHTVALAKGSMRRAAILYRDVKGVASSRVILPKAVVGGFVDDRLTVHSIRGHCELANASRKFRIDRILMLNDVDSGAEIDIRRWVMGLDLDARELSRALETEHASVGDERASIHSVDASDAQAAAVPVFDEEAYFAELVRDRKASPEAIAAIRKAFLQNKLDDARKEQRRAQKALNNLAQQEAAATPGKPAMPAATPVLDLGPPPAGLAQLPYAPPERQTNRALNWLIAGFVIFFVFLLIVSSARG